MMSSGFKRNIVFMAVPRNKIAPFPSSAGKETIRTMLSSLKEAVRTTVACECVFVRGAVIKALIWLQSPHESFDELKSIIAGELSDPSWPASLLNEILLTLHARFKVRVSIAHCLYHLKSFSDYNSFEQRQHQTWL